MTQMIGRRGALLGTASIAAGSLAAGSLAAPAIAQGAAGEITLVAYSGIFQDNYTAAVVNPFMQRFPSIKVNYFPAAN
ncbi:MAG: hypothetical protein IT556_02550, partial [Acetobacteraceae bacterium]|nr:hypothetical protein [Acetobacteraceae bacterium]